MSVVLPRVSVSLSPLKTVVSLPGHALTFLLMRLFTKPLKNSLSRQLNKIIKSYT